MIPLSSSNCFELEPQRKSINIDPILADKLSEIRQQLELKASAEQNRLDVKFISGCIYQLEEAEEELKEVDREDKINELTIKINRLYKKLEKIKVVREAAIKTFGRTENSNKWKTLTCKGSRHYYVKKDESEGLIIVSKKFLTKLNKQIASGAFGIIYGHEKGPKMGVVGKTAFSLTSQKRAIRQQRNEYEVLKILQKNDVASGIMPAPKALVLTEKGENIMLCKRFHKDLFEAVAELSQKQLLNGFANILKGLIHIHQFNFLHGDIKPENIACFKNGNNITLKLIDFGFSSEISMDNIDMINDYITPGYYPIEYFYCNYKKLRMNLLFDMLVKRDCFAFAKSLVDSIIKNSDNLSDLIFKYKEAENLYFPTLNINASELKKQIIKNGYSQDLCELLIEIFIACKIESPVITRERKLEWVKKIEKLASNADIATIDSTASFLPDLSENNPLSLGKSNSRSLSDTEPNFGKNTTTSSGEQALVISGEKDEEGEECTCCQCIVS